jgi:hypothetical protein
MTMPLSVRHVGWPTAAGRCVVRTCEGRQRMGQRAATFDVISIWIRSRSPGGQGPKVLGTYPMAAGRWSYDVFGASDLSSTVMRRNMVLAMVRNSARWCMPLVLALWPYKAP